MQSKAGGCKGPHPRRGAERLKAFGNDRSILAEWFCGSLAQREPFPICFPSLYLTAVHAPRHCEPAAYTPASLRTSCVYPHVIANQCRSTGVAILGPVDRETRRRVRLHHSTKTLCNRNAQRLPSLASLDSPPVGRLKRPVGALPRNDEKRVSLQTGRRFAMTLFLFIHTHTVPGR